jgi:hypothetical protein
MYDFDPDDERQDTWCKRCEAYPLWWEELHGKWVLVDEEGTPHDCSARRASANEFPNLGEE